MEYISTQRLSKIRDVIKSRQSGFVVVLEDVHNPHNAAAVLRTCDSFGIKDVYFIFKNQKEYNPKSIGKSSSSSANKWLEFKTFYSTKDCFNFLKEKGYKIYVTALNKNSKTLDKVSFCTNKLAIVFGNEHKGVSKQAISKADEVIMIPQKGMVQSLNISVSAAIFIYEATKQRGGKYKLTSSEQKQLLENYKSKASKSMIKLSQINDQTR